MPPKKIKVVNREETRFVTPQEFAKIVMRNPNQVLPTYLENLCDKDTGEVFAIRMEFGGWEVTAAGFKAIEGFFGKE